MRVHEILRKYNIGLSTLNDYLELVNLDKVEINTKLDKNDFIFVCRLLDSKNLKKYEEIAQELNHKLYLAKEELHKELLNKMPLLEEMGLLQRKYYFRKITSCYYRVIDKYQLPISKEYTDDSFKTLYKLYMDGELGRLMIKMNSDFLQLMKTIRKENNQISKWVEEYDGDKDSHRTNQKIVDGESEIMSALRHGDGDLFGY
jgi:hypothetical protein